MSDETQSLDVFRQKVAKFLDEELSDRIREGGKKTTSMFSPFAEAMAFQQALHAKGWSGVSWPREYGGTGWSLAQQNIFQEECRVRELPFLLPNGLQMVGPVLMKFGTEEQKQRYLPGILSGEEYWAQGYSEPGSGSDLVSLKCRADRDGDEYVINGSKIWTTYAHHSKRMFMLVRTDFDCKPQRGITFLLLDSLDLPGMEVREIIGLDGVPEQCEVFFDNVRVPISNRLGEENDGWSVAKYLLVHERGSSLSMGVIMENELQRIRRLASEMGDGFGGVLVDDSAFQRRFADLQREAATVDALEDKMFRIDKSSPESGPYSSLIKIAWTESLQRLCEFAIDVCGSVSLPLQLAALEVGSGVEPIGPEDALTLMPKYLNNHAASIYGGSNEIQREIIAKAIVDGRN
ncbi:acyl-CoA dehydrogenase [Spongiibacter sp. KMU-166]|uniref:Acyl-CoA dehydrogenase n=1 Tax=Spongiibacter thalassae TaxID=2721624 RepID=A0ABX1G9R6_9GAMM|nr:acyl-CoA dehydrogenase family protein [Spongiibacter thalassae]NKI15906.1 acyl-CoA dehydrogenase [Spongiibacter thalassae]